MRSDPNRFDPGDQSLLGRDLAMWRGFADWLRTGRRLGDFRGPLLAVIAGLVLIVVVAVLINVL